ncbi:MAG: AI-2E family transporter [Pseudonocardia sp.]|nr:AI-2E family transporter [Pseudonocardia sp.]
MVLPTRGAVNPLFGFAAVVVVVAGLRGFGELLAPLFLALVLVVTVTPMAAALRRRGLPRWLATIVTLLAVYAILLALVGSLVYTVAELVRVLPGYGPQFNDLVVNAAAQLSRLGVGPPEIQSALSQFDIGSAVGFLQGLLGQLAGVLTTLLLILSVLLFMTIDSTSFPERLLAIGRSRPHIVTALTSFSHGTRRFLAVSTIFGLLVATLDVLVLTVLDVPLALLFGLLSLIANYIPNVGFLLALFPPALLAFLEGGPGLMLAVIVAFLVINTLLQTIIQPRFIGDAVGLSVTVTFLALVFWGWVLGPLGALLAIPLTLLAKALLVDSDPHTRWINSLIAARPPHA